MRRRLPVAAALGLALLAGCGGGSAAGPPQILFGQDICDRCRMVVSEERHAAAARAAGSEYRFDDPGCLSAFQQERQGGVEAAWVHDAAGSWLPVEEAWLAVDPEGGTPMASGILAFASHEAATTAARRYGGEPLRWAALATTP